MQQSCDLSIYLSELDSVIKLFRLENSTSTTTLSLGMLLNSLDNYLDQFKCVSKASLLEEKSDNPLDDIDEDQVKKKLLFKLNQLVSENLEKIEIIL